MPTPPPTLTISPAFPSPVPPPPPSPDGIVVDCPTCKRTIWGGTACAHGAVPPPSVSAPFEAHTAQHAYKPKTRDRRRGTGS
jgi:hypothetical protein